MAWGRPHRTTSRASLPAAASARRRGAVSVSSESRWQLPKLSAHGARPATAASTTPRSAVGSCSSLGEGGGFGYEAQIPSSAAGGRRGAGARHSTPGGCAAQRGEGESVARVHPRLGLPGRRGFRLSRRSGGWGGGQRPQGSGVAAATWQKSVSACFTSSIRDTPAGRRRSAGRAAAGLGEGRSTARRRAFHFVRHLCV